jgi:hypothetical protein
MMFCRLMRRTIGIRIKRTPHQRAPSPLGIFPVLLVFPILLLAQGSRAAPDRRDHDHCRTFF